MKKYIILNFILIVSMIVFSACGSNSKSDGGGVNSPGTVGLSIVYESTEYDEERGFIDHFRVHATDDNGEPISNLKLNMSLINGVKEIRNSKLQHEEGNIQSSTPITFYDEGIDFSQTDVKVGDNLIVIPSSGKTNNAYMGDWTISRVGVDLAFSEGSFNLESTDDLTYIIGNEKRFLGDSRGRVAIAHIESPKGADGAEAQGTTNAEGFTYFDVVYDPILGGHTVTLGVHTKGNRKSAGQIVGLRGGEFSGEPVTVTSTGQTQFVNMGLSVGFGGGGAEALIDVSIIPSSFKVEPSESCKLNKSLSNLHANANGNVLLAIDTFVEPVDENATEEPEVVQCAISWIGSNTSIYFEY